MTQRHKQPLPQGDFFIFRKKDGGFRTFRAWGQVTAFPLATWHTARATEPSATQKPGRTSAAKAADFSTLGIIMCTLWRIFPAKKRDNGLFSAQIVSFSFFRGKGVCHRLAPWPQVFHNHRLICSSKRLFFSACSDSSAAVSRPSICRKGKPSNSSNPSSRYRA